jgi:hypothetical protein
MNRQATNRTSMFVIYMCHSRCVSICRLYDGSVFVERTTESDAAEASEEGQNTAEPLELISTIQCLLDQAVIEYDN